MWTVGREKEGERVKKTKKKESREVGGGDGERKGKRKKETEGEVGRKQGMAAGIGFALSFAQPTKSVLSEESVFNPFQQ